ncbi:MAG: AAA family ATPase [Vampirovibrionia bacterium]
MAVTIAVTGKGGTGKTIIVSVLLQILNKKYPDSSILAIDANLNCDMGRYLGIDITNTLYDIRLDKYKYSYEMPQDISKQEKIDLCIEDMITPLNQNVDVIASGTSVSIECTCANAKIIRERMKHLAKNYDIVVIDCADDIVYLKNVINTVIDSIIIVADSSRSAITSAARLKYSARDMLLPDQTTLLLNKIKQRNLPDSISALIDKFDLDIVGIIPFDNELRDYEYAGKSIYKLDDENSPIPQAIEQTLYRLNLPR